MAHPNTTTILGINFTNERVAGIIDFFRTNKGLLVAPSGPGLATVKTDLPYYNSLLSADIVIPDSGYMALIWNSYHAKKIHRVSGLEFLIAFFRDKQIIDECSILLVDPRSKEADANLQYLQSIGFTGLSVNSSYISPMYDPENVIDPALLAIVEAKKPAYVLLNIGGGIQEKLGHYLKTNLSYKPGIICTGAAIAFLTGHQVKIPTWADKFFLGWLFRCFQNPKLYISRYWKSFKLVSLIIKYGSKNPNIES